MIRQAWSVYVPCYNEGGNLKPVVESITCVMNEIASEFEIIIVDDGSTDDSANVIAKLEKENSHVGSVIHASNQGIGSVQRRAYTTAKFENVIVIGGDGQFNPSELLQHGNIQNNTWLSFHRVQLDEYSLFRKLLSRAHKVLNHHLFQLRIKDVNWAMAFKSADLKKLDLRMSSTLIKSEACIKLQLLGWKVVEIPSIYHPRKTGKAKGASFRIIFQALKELFTLYQEVARFRKNLSHHRNATRLTP